MVFRRALLEQTKEREVKEVEYQEKVRAAQDLNEDTEALHEEYRLMKAE